MPNDSPTVTIPERGLTVEAGTKVFASLLSPEDTGTRETQAPKPEPVEEETDTETEAEVDKDNAQVEGAEAPADQSDATETTEQTSQTPRTFRVKVDGEEIEVPEDELLKGYSRTADYTRKTQALAEQRKTLEAETAAARERREAYAQQLAAAEGTLRQIAPQEPDWDRVRAENPEAYPILWAEWSRFKEQLQTVAAARQQVAMEQMADLERRRMEALTAERQKLEEAVPEWRDPKKWAADRDELVGFVTSHGYGPADLAQVTDHRLVMILRKAMLYDKAEKAKEEGARKLQAQSGGIKPATPGQPPPVTSKSRSLDRSFQRLAKSGRVDDATSVFRQLIDD